MAGKSAGVITINLNAGTAQFVQDLSSAKGKVVDFGKAAAGAGNAHRSSMIEASAAIRGLEGNFDRNIRAVERFASTTLGLGPIFKAAFPLIGGIAFGSMLVELGSKVYEFYKGIQQAPEKVKGAFRELIAPMRLANDELAVANARLENEIAKLQGKRQNTVALQLLEAKAAADKLADALQRDLAGLNKLLSEQKVGVWRQLWGEAGTKDIAEEIGGKTGFGGFRGKISGITNADWLKQEYQAEIQKLESWLSTSEIAQAQRTNPDWQRRTGGPDQTVRIEQLRGVIQELKEEAGNIDLSKTHESLTEKKDQVTAANANAAEDRPFQDRIKALTEELASAKAKTMAAGWSESAKVVEQAYGKTLQVIMEVNKALERRRTQLTPSQEGQIGSMEQAIAAAEAEGEWQKKLASTTAQIKDQVRSQELLTAAVGRGYQAIRAANVETRLMQSVGGERYNDPAWMRAHAGEVSSLRSGFGAEFDAQRNDRSAGTVSQLQNQIQMERSLAQVQSQGAEAVRLVTLAYKLRELTAKGATAAEIRAEIDLYNATRANAAAADIAKINERTDAIKRLADAQRQGAEAVRKATLENKYAELARNGATPDQISATRQSDAAEHEMEITKAVSERVNVYADELAKLDQEKENLTKNLDLYKNTADVARTLRDLEDSRLKILVQQQLAQRDAMSGVRAFFLEMQEQAKSTAAIIYETLNKALDQVSSNLTKLITGQGKKGDWGKLFKGLGEQLVQSVIKAGLEKGLGALGKAAHLDGQSPSTAPWVRIAGPGGTTTQSPSILNGNGGLLGTGRIPKAGGGPNGGPGQTPIGDDGSPIAVYITTGKPDGTSGNPFYVMFAGGGDSLNFGPNQIQQPGPQGPNWLQSIGSTVTGIGISGAIGAATAWGSAKWGGPRADGGQVSAGDAYLVGERGPEPFFPGVSGTVLSNAAMRRAGLGGDNHYYNIDARGSDPHLVEQHVIAAIKAVHGQAVTTSLRASHDMARRTVKHN
jgi:hypothetical protein